MAKMDRYSPKATKMTRAEITALVQRVNGIAALLEEAEPVERAAAYADLGIRLVYDHRTSQVLATADLTRVAKRVGGGT